MTARRTGEEIVDQVARAAYRLFIQRGPAAVTVREIAAEADVNAGLIHRYVGSKDDIIALVLDRHGERARAALREISDLDGILDLLARSPQTSSGRLYAGVALSNPDVFPRKRDFPVISAVMEALDGREIAEDPAVVSALMQSLTLGWELLAPFLLRGAGMDMPKDEERVLRQALERLVGLPDTHQHARPPAAGRPTRRSRRRAPDPAQSAADSPNSRSSTQGAPSD